MPLYVSNKMDTIRTDKKLVSRLSKVIALTRLLADVD
jgi:hypothetical protein